MTSFFKINRRDEFSFIQFLTDDWTIRGYATIMSEEKPYVYKPPCLHQCRVIANNVIEIVNHEKQEKEDRAAIRRQMNEENIFHNQEYALMEEESRLHQLRKERERVLEEQMRRFSARVDVDSFIESLTPLSEGKCDQDTNSISIEQALENDKQ